MKSIPHSTLNNWLIYPGSFMRRLKEYGIHDAKVQVEEEGFSVPSTKECAALGMAAGREAWVREVVISSDSLVLMFARSVIPLETLTGKEEALRHLNNRSLGSFLFEDPDLKRSAFEIVPVEASSDAHQKVSEKIFVPEETLWSRTSLFETHQKKILLTEIFFPAVGLLT